jgi:ATP-dependent DNA ligase
MLAKVYEDHSSKINWDGDVFIQPKLDGMRCLVIVKEDSVKLISRKNKPIETMGHIEKQMAEFPNGIYDGELYAHGKTFQENMKLIKKYRKGESEQVHFHIYDMVKNDSFIQRYTHFAAIYGGLKDKCTNIERVVTYRLKTESGISIIHSDFLQSGYEGSMIRHGKEVYKINGRSDQLLKYKQFKDIACKILDIEPADARPEWGTPVCEYNGHTFRAGTKLSHDERKELLTNKTNYIGQTAEIRYFEETDDGLPRFPVMVGIRLDK